MSHELTESAWAVDGLKPSEKLVLLYAADIAREPHNAMWSKQKTIADRCGLTKDTVKIALRSLVEKGHLVRTVRPNTSSFFHVTPRREFLPREETTQEVAANNNGAKITPDGGEIRPEGGAKFALRTVSEPSFQPVPSTDERCAPPEYQKFDSQRIHPAFAKQIVADSLFKKARGSQQDLAHLANVSTSRLSLFLSDQTELSDGERVRLVAAAERAEREEMFAESIPAAPLRARLRKWKGSGNVVCQASGLNPSRLSAFKHGRSDLTHGGRRALKAALDELLGDPADAKTCN